MPSLCPGIKMRPTPRRNLFPSCLLVLLSISSILITPGYPQSNLPAGFEEEIKASFIYTLAKFVRWPARSFSTDSSPLIFCTLGDDPLNPVLERVVDGKTINGRKLAYRGLADAHDIDRCHVLFVGSSELGHLREVLSGMRGSSVMTVGESDRFTSFGGMVCLRIHETMVQSEINVPEARRAGLQISSDFLKLSGVVKVRTQNEK
jgi:uncharacterized protein DUF4154